MVCANFSNKDVNVFLSGNVIEILGMKIPGRSTTALKTEEEALNVFQIIVDSALKSMSHILKKGVA